MYKHSAEVMKLIKTSDPSGISTKIKSNTNIYTDILTHYPEGIRLSEKIYLYANNMMVPICGCGSGKSLLFNSVTKGYRTGCSATCKQVRKSRLDSRRIAQGGKMGNANSESYHKSTTTLLLSHTTNAHGIKPPLEEIQSIIALYPRHYSGMIRGNHELHRWVVENSLIQSDKFVERIYSAIHQDSNVCKYGNVRTISRLSEGWTRCGPASTCRCTAESIAMNVSVSKSNYTDKQREEINATRKETMVKLYGVPYNTQRPEVRLALSKPKIPSEAYDLLTDYAWLYDQYITQSKTLSHIADDLGIYYGTVAWYCHKFGFEIRQRSNYSLEEVQICNYIGALGVKYETGNYSVLGGKEIDILIPELNVGFEVNGLRWHSYNPHCTQTKELEDKHRHRSKTLLAKSAGVELTHITDFEWANQRALVESLIRGKLGKSTILYARKLTLREVTKDDEREFLKANHFQGPIGSSYAIGLYNGDVLCSIMTVGKSRYNSVAQLEILRICTVLNHIVVGGSERMFAQIRKVYPNSTIVSYCDLTKFTGHVYGRLGFTRCSKEDPSPHWTDGNHLLSRQKCTRKQLAKWLTSFDDSLSVTTNMFNAKYRRYWDCGQSTWIFTPTQLISKI